MEVYQLTFSVWRLTHRSPHSVGLSLGQTQMPARQGTPAGHVLPQSPQLACHNTPFECRQPIPTTILRAKAITTGCGPLCEPPGVTQGQHASLTRSVVERPYPMWYVELPSPCVVVVLTVSSWRLTHVSPHLSLGHLHSPSLHHWSLAHFLPQPPQLSCRGRSRAAKPRMVRSRLFKT